MARVELPLEVEEFLSWMVAEKGRSPNTLCLFYPSHAADEDDS